MVPAGRVDHRASDRARLGGEVGVGELHQVVPGAEDRVVGRRSLLEVAAPAGHDLGPQVLGRQRQEEDGRLERVGLGQWRRGRGSRRRAGGRSPAAAAYWSSRNFRSSARLAPACFSNSAQPGSALQALDERQLAGAPRCWRRRRRANNSRPSGSGRTCDRGSGRRPPSGPAGRGVTVSIRSSIWSWMLLSNIRPERQEAHRRQPPGLVLGRDHVGGELLVDEPVEGQCPR